MGLQTRYAEEVFLCVFSVSSVVSVFKSLPQRTQRAQKKTSHEAMANQIGSVRRALALLQRGVDNRVGADFVVRTLGPALHGKICGINARNAAFAHHNFTEDIPVHRD